MAPFFVSCFSRIQPLSENGWIVYSLALITFEIELSLNFHNTVANPDINYILYLCISISSHVDLRKYAVGGNACTAR